MVMEITEALLRAQAVDSTTRNAAEETLKQLQDLNLPTFLLSLALELANEGKPVESRQLAGLILKNALDQHRNTDLWLSLDFSFQSQIKSCLLQSLSSTAPIARSTAAQVTAKVAGINLRLNKWQWPLLITSLLSNTHQQTLPHLKQSTFQTLGYLFEEEVQPDVIDQNQSNKILTALLQGMDANHGNNTQVRLAATRALYNALGFFHSYLSTDENQFAYLMRVVCETTLAPEVQLRQAAFECLVSMGSTYYLKLPPYIQDIINITCNAIQTDEECVAIQAFEFWSSICDKEVDILDKCEGEFTSASDVPFCYLINQALPTLVPLLLETLLKKEINLAMAGGACLSLVSRIVGNDIVPFVMPFIKDNIKNPDWRLRQAATYAFGYILDAPSHYKLLPMIKEAPGSMLSVLTERRCTPLRNTTAWTLGRIFGVLHDSPTSFPGIQITSAHCQSVIPVILQTVNDDPDMAEKACGALCYLAKYHWHMGSNPLLTPYFQEIVQSLLNVTHSKGAGQSRLRKAAYEALNEVVRYSSRESYHVVLKLFHGTVTDLHNTLRAQIELSDKKQKQSELQGLLLFGLLRVIICRLGASEPNTDDLMQYADQIINFFPQVFASGMATFHKEAMLAIGAFPNMIGPGFVEYMPTLSNYLARGLHNFDEHQLCDVTIGVVVDICGALGDKVLPYCDEIMPLLLKALSSTRFRRSVKPHICRCFGAIARAIKEKFQKYLVHVMPILHSASESAAHKSEDNVEVMKFINLFRDGIWEAYSEICNCYDEFPKFLLPYAYDMLRFMFSMPIETRYSSRYKIEMRVSKAAKEELELTKEILSKDKRNYEAWFRRQWIIPMMDRRTWLSEIQYCHDIIDKDIFNVSAWDQICRTVGKNNIHLDMDLRDRETEYARKAIYSQPGNEGPWLYLRFLYMLDKKRLYEDTVLESIYVDLLAKEACQLKSTIELDPPILYMSNYVQVDRRSCVHALNLVADLMLLGYKADQNKSLVEAVDLLYANMAWSFSYVNLPTIQLVSKFYRLICTLVLSLDAFRVRYCYMYRGYSLRRFPPVEDMKEYSREPHDDKVVDLFQEKKKEFIESWLTLNDFINLRPERKQCLLETYLQKRNCVENDALEDMMWHARRIVTKDAGDNSVALEQLLLTTKIIEDDPYDHRAWFHRQWLYHTYAEDWSDKVELEFCAKVIAQNPFNTFAWDQRYFLVTRYVTKIYEERKKKNGMDEQAEAYFEEIRDEEVDFALKYIISNPENQLAWGQIGGVYNALPCSHYTFCCSDSIRRTIADVLDKLSGPSRGLSSLKNPRGMINSINMLLDIIANHHCSFVDEDESNVEGHRIKTLLDEMCPDLLLSHYEDFHEFSPEIKVNEILRAMKVAAMDSGRWWRHATDEFLTREGCRGLF